MEGPKQALSESYVLLQDRRKKEGTPVLLGCLLTILQDMRDHFLFSPGKHGESP